MKKAIAVLLALSMTVPLAACSGQRTEPKAEKETSAIAAAEPVTESQKESQTAAETSKEAEQGKAPRDYPNKPVTLLITFEAGGTTDVATRLFVKYWQKHLPKNVNVINIDGAGGNVGMEEAKKQANDGYYLVVQSAPFAMNAAMGSASFTYEDFEPISLFFESYMALCVRSDSPYQTFDDFARAVKEPGNDLKYGVYAGSPMVSILLALQDHLGTKLNVVDIPKTKATELLAGRVDAYCDAFAQTKSYIDSGDFRCLGVFASERLSDYPDIPAMKEAGMDYIITEQKYGMWAPKGTPDDILEYLNQTIKLTYDDPEYAAELSKMSFVPIYTTRGDYLAWQKDIYAKFDDFVQTLEP